MLSAREKIGQQFRLAQAGKGYWSEGLKSALEKSGDGGKDSKKRRRRRRRSSTSTSSSNSSQSCSSQKTAPATMQHTMMDQGEDGHDSFGSHQSFTEGMASMHNTTTNTSIVQPSWMQLTGKIPNTEMTTTNLNVDTNNLNSHVHTMMNNQCSTMHESPSMNNNNNNNNNNNALSMVLPIHDDSSYVDEDTLREGLSHLLFNNHSNNNNNST